MANRFLDTNYYKSPFVRGLKGALKSLYSFIICDCDGAGVWGLDLEVASLYIGFPITKQEFVENFVDTAKARDIGNNRYFFPDFIEHQYPQGLQDTNPAHKNFIITLQKFNLIDENLDVIEAPLKPLQSTTGNGNGNGNGNGGEAPLMEVHSSRKTRPAVKPKTTKNIIDPFGGAILVKWDEWLEYKLKEKKFKFKTEKSESQALQNLFEMSNGKMDVAEKIINQSIGNGWAGLFPLRNNGNTYNGKQKDLSGGLKLDTGDSQYDDMKK